MNRVIALSCFFILTGVLSAQDNPNTYYYSIEKAADQAAMDDKFILMVFAGSDWCRPCMQFKKEILENASVAGFVEENLIILYLDFPSRKKNRLPPEQTAYNEGLAEQFNPTGAFPRILLLDGHKNLLGEIKYTNQSPALFIATCQDLIQP